MLVLHLDPLGAETRNRHDARGELLAAPGRAAALVSRAFAHLQQPRIDGLSFRLLVDFSRAAPLQNHAGDSGDVVPDGEIGDRRLPWQSELVHALLNRGTVVSENLPQLHARHAVVDADPEHHLVERENRGVGLLPVSRDQHARVRQRS